MQHVQSRRQNEAINASITYITRDLAHLNHCGLINYGARSTRKEAPFNIFDRDDRLTFNKLNLSPGLLDLVLFLTV